MCTCALFISVYAKYVLQDSIMCDIARLMCELTESPIRTCSHVYVCIVYQCLCQICITGLSYVWHGTQLCVTWLVSCVTWLSHQLERVLMCDITQSPFRRHSQVWHDSVIYVTCLCHGTQSYLWRDSIFDVTVCATKLYVWRNSMFDVTLCVTNLYVYVTQYLTWLYICRNCFIDMTQHFPWLYMWRDSMCDVTNSHVWRDSFREQPCEDRFSAFSPI